MTTPTPITIDDFDVYKYAALEDFDRTIWAQLIESRLVCERMIRAAQQQAHSSGSMNAFATCAEQLINHLFDTPLTPFGKGLRDTLLRADQTEPSVRPLLVAEIIALHRGVMEHAPLTVVVKNNEIEYWTATDEQPEIFDTAIDDAIAESKHYNIRNLARFQIDLQASDKQIIDDFKQLLSSYRKRTSFAPPTITEAKLKQWFRNRVLPYTDLKLWAQWTNTKLKNRDLVELLFPDTEALANHPIDSIRRDCRDAISSTTVSALLQTQSKPT